jgi:hypothetical protein
LNNKEYTGLSRGDFFTSVFNNDFIPAVNHPAGLKKYDYSGKFSVSLSSNISYFFKNGVHVIFSGNLYKNNPAEAVFNDYILFKEDTFKNLNGKFALCIFDSNLRQLFLISDRVNSYKIFYKFDEHHILAGTDINYLKDTDEKLDMGAVGSYLVNSVPMGNKTVYKNISKVPAGSYVKFDLSDRSKKIFSYWKIKFTNDYKNVKTNELIEELKPILIRSFKRRIYDNKKILLSFSGGTDSRGLLALLTSKEINYKNIEIFTYKHGNIKKDDPTYISKKIAEEKGFNIKIINQYNNNIENCIKLNVKLGCGTAHFCTDVDAWESLKQDYSAGNNKIMVGDIIDGVPYGFSGDYSRALEKNYIYPASFLNSYRNIFNEGYFDKIYHEYRNDYEQILKESMKYENVLDSMWHTYLAQRVSNILNVYRENFISYFMDVECPYYDNEVLDFLNRLPLEQRLYKKIFLETYKSIDPEIMKVKYPSEQEENINWDHEIKKNKELYYVFNSISRLDFIISDKQMIDCILNSTSGSDKSSNYTKYLYPVHNAINKVFPNYHRIFLNDNVISKINQRFKHKNIDCFILKYLILRGVLNQ